MSNLTHQINTILPTITGWCTTEKGNDLALAVIKLRSSVSIELGVWGGKSLMALALAHKEQKHGMVYAVDPWSPSASVENQNEVNAKWWGSVDHEAIYQSFLANLKKHGVEGFVNVVRLRSDDFTPPDEIDFLHIDGNHSDQAIKDVERYASNIRHNGFVFCDDIFWEGLGVARAVEKLLTMGFVKIFDRDTGAMFQRIEVKRKVGWPKGKARGKKKAKK